MFNRVLLKPLIGLWIVFFGLLNQTLISSEPNSETDEEVTSKTAIQELYKSCQLCHSTREMQRGPIIDGWPAWYVESQLFKFRKNIRGNDSRNKSEVLMRVGMSVLESDSQVRELARYISTLDIKKSIRTARGDVNKGKTIFLRCLPCHGNKAEGIPLLKTPPLIVMEDWYLVDQIRKFQMGWRGNSERDPHGLMMAVAVKPLSKQDILDVVVYIGKLAGY
ncbi:MAG TPA: c-type cytochrome [Verrucomicrobiales bacterium]|jgi:cytochrome c553|nr:c-type cytochrome [Verrucomicrobiales bacterium]HIL72421.1 c-type cytochrome [Verrucomicrobiota bacterium]